MRNCATILCLLLSLHCIAQQQKLDSLIALNENYKNEDSIKVVYLTNIFRQYGRLKNVQKAEEYSNKALAIAKKLPTTFSLTYVYERLGLYYHGTSNFNKAIDAYTNGINISKQRNDKESAATFYLDIGALYATIPDYAKALEANLIAVDIYSEIGSESDLGNCYMNIGLVYQSLQQLDKSIAYTQKALTVFIKDDDGINYGVATAYESIANTYMASSDADLINMGIKPNARYIISIQYLNDALKVAKQLNINALIADIYKDMGNVFQRMGDHISALKNYQLALDLTDTDNKVGQASLYSSMGSYYGSIHENEKGVYYLNKGLLIAKQSGLLETQQNALLALSVLYEQNFKYDTAFTFYKDYIIVKDSIYNQEKEKEITRKQMQLDFNIKEHDYKLMQEITDGKLKQQFLLATQQQQQLTLKQQQLQLISKEKDLQQLAYLKRQSELQNEKQLQASLLQKNTLQSKYDKEISNKQIASKNLQINYGKKIMYFLAIAILLLTVIALLIYYNQRKTKRLNKVIVQQKGELEQLGSVKDRILGVVSHDMRTPVNSLVSFIQLLENQEIPPQKLNLYANELKNQLTYTSNLMGNLLKWAASQMQGFKPNIQAINALETTNNIINTLQQHASQKQVTIENKIDSAINVNADKDMFALIIRNLLGNAIKYSYKDAVVQLNAIHKHDVIEFAVIDSGVGIDENKLQLINESHTSSIDSSAGTQNEKGTGLGLMLCKTFAVLMNGSIHAESKIGAGSTFLFTLPVNQNV